MIGAPRLYINYATQNYSEQVWNMQSSLFKTHVFLVWVLNQGKIEPFLVTHKCVIKIIKQMRHDYCE